MIVIGLLLLLAVIAVVVVMVMAGGNTVNIGWDAVNLNWAPTALTIYLLGAATLLLLVLSFAALRTGTRRKVAKGQELRRLRKLESEQGVGTGRHAAPAPATPPPPVAGSGPATGPGSALGDNPAGTHDPYGPGDSKLG